MSLSFTADYRFIRAFCFDGRAPELAEPEPIGGFGAGTGVDFGVGFLVAMKLSFGFE